MKKLISLLLAIVLLLSLCSTAFAATSFAYTDYLHTDWYFRYVEKAIANGWMNGVGGQDFDPNGTLNRAMFVTILHRMEGSPAATKAAGFSDVAQGAWYENAVNWAAENGVVTGYADGRFGVSDPLTREQMATILFRFSAAKGMNAVTMEENLLGFADEKEISSYAITAMNWAVGQGILTGANNRLTPKGTSTRAQAATVLCRLDAKEEAATLTRADLEQAVVELGWDYFVKGTKIQYDSQNMTEDIISKYYSGTYRVTEDAPPEYGTKDTAIFSVCSDFVQKSYYNALNERFFGYPLDWVTRCLWSNSENIYGKDLVVARYWDDARIDGGHKGDVLKTTPHRMTSAEMREFFLNWKDTMRPGDVLVPNGHAMLYVGNGYVIDCAGQKYNMGTGADSYESSGAVSKLRTVIGCYVTGVDSNNAYSFPEGQECNTSTFVVLRPINAIVTEDGDGDLSNDKAIDAVSITEAAKTRMQNPAMDIDRTVSIGPLGTAVTGGELTYTVKVFNKSYNKNYVTFRQAADPAYAGEVYKGLTVTETIPEGTEFVSASEGGKYENGTITWTADVPADGAAFSYTVKVTAPVGGTIVSTGGFVGSIPSNTLTNKVGGQKLSDESNVLDDFYHRYNQNWAETYGLTVTDDTSMAEEIYSKVLGKKLELPTAQELFDGIYEQVHVNQRVGLGYNRGNTKEAWMYTPVENVYEKNPMLVRTYLGGKGTWFRDDLDRINEFSKDYLEPGDIIVHVNLTDYDGATPRKVKDSKVIVWLGNNTCAAYDKETKTWSRDRGLSMLWKAYQYDAFFMLRPSQLGELSDSGMQVKPEGQVITQVETKEQRQAAVVAAAWAYLDKGEKLQYDTSAVSSVGTSKGGNGRFGIFAAPEEITSHRDWYIAVHGMMLTVFGEAIGYRYADSPTPVTYERIPGIMNENNTVFVWTNEDMADVPTSAEVKNMLQPGDLLIVTIGSNDYIYSMYLGDDLITTHEIATSQRFQSATGEERREEGGAAKVVKYSETVTDAYLKTAAKIYVVRFVDDVDYDTACVTPASQSRVQYPRMTIDRTVNVGPYGTVLPGQELTYSVVIENKGTAAYTALPVTETVPAGTELVKADGAKNENGTLTWSVDVPAGGSKTLTYTVKVTAGAGERIVSAGGKVAEIPSNVISTTVGKDLISADAQKRMADLAGKTGETIEKELQLEGEEIITMAQKVYSYILTGKTDASMSKVVPSGSQLAKIFTAGGKNSLGIYELVAPEKAADKTVRSMLVDGWFGGYNVHVQENKDRLMDFCTDLLSAGDLLVKQEKEGSIYCIYLGGGKFVQVSYEDSSVTVTDETPLVTCLKKTHLYFALFRPSQAFSLSEITG